MRLYPVKWVLQDGLRRFEGLTRGRRQRKKKVKWFPIVFVAFCDLVFSKFSAVLLLNRHSIILTFLVLCFLEDDDLDQSTPSETELFTKYYNEWKGAGKGKTKSYDAIPRFYFKVEEFSFVTCYSYS